LANYALSLNEGQPNEYVESEDSQLFDILKSILKFNTVVTGTITGLSRETVSPYLLLLQSALQPLWVLACSTIAEYSQREGFYRVPLPAACQTP